MSKFDIKKINKSLQFVLFVAIVTACIILFARGARFNDFFNAMESKTFDLRQTILVNSHAKKPSKDIVLLTIDDASYEYLLDQYGEWPVPREVFANLINYLELQKPRAIAFDLMFIKSLKSKHNSDEVLAKAITKHNNVYTSMNFDYEPADLRVPAKLPDYLKVNVNNLSKNISFSDLTFTNCRTILPQIINGTSHIGFINVTRENDGILRRMPLFMNYQNEFYPHMALLMGLKTLTDKDDVLRSFTIDKNSDIKIGNKTIPVDKDGEVILNWYGPAGQSFDEVPMYKIIKAIKNKDKKPIYDFKDKIIYVGTTAVSLYDTKSVPVDSVYPGVEAHTTFVSNFINNEFIKKVDSYFDILISLVLAFLIGFIVFKSESIIVSLSATILISFIYIILTYYIMQFFNLWLPIVIPIISISLVFAAVYIVKYILKSRDFEHQYRLATTDGLTELYNHRYFQEQMILQIANSKRYDSKFSLIMVDIDFFKKFNDIFGHQSGDAVLKQVAAKLKKNVRATDFVCRYGGEEMAIILPNTDSEEAFLTAQKLCQVIAEKPFKLANNQESNVTISLGVATFPQEGQTSDQIIESADKRLYTAKENGRNQVGK